MRVFRVSASLQTKKCEHVGLTTAARIENAVKYLADRLYTLYLEIQATPLKSARLSFSRY